MPATAPSVYEQLGVAPVINARGHQTLLGGSTPSPRVKAAMEQAERHYVDMEQLLQRSGEAIARLLNAEAAYVTSGAAAALALGAAACITGSDVAKMRRLPDTRGLRRRVVIQAGQRYKYEHAVTIVGAALAAAGSPAGTTADQLAASLDQQTAAVLYPAHLEGAPGTLALAEVLAIAHDHGVPVLVDAAGQVFPLERFTGLARTGADLLCFGAKYVGSPHSSGILCGRRDLVAAAARQGFIGFEASADHQVVGRPMKLDRQEIVAVVAAVQEWLAMDHTARLARLEGMLQRIGRQVEGLPGVSLDYREGGGTAPRTLRLALGPAARRDAAALVAALRAGPPAIAVGDEPGAIVINPVTLADGEEEVVARRLRELLA